MIVFDLRCGGGHVFEAWFGSSADYESQRERGLVYCPICGSDEVGKAVMAPAIAAKGNRAGPNLPMAAAGDDAARKAMLAKLAAAQARVLKGSSWVGGRFAEKARAMHDGEEAHRPIHGQATLAEARSLAEDGVPVAPLPLPVTPPGTEN